MQHNLNTTMFWVNLFTSMFHCIKTACTEQQEYICSCGGIGILCKLEPVNCTCDLHNIKISAGFKIQDFPHRGHQLKWRGVPNYDFGSRYDTGTWGNYLVGIWVMDKHPGHCIQNYFSYYHLIWSQVDNLSRWIFHVTWQYLVSLSVKRSIVKKL